jgi:hypothetical protein
MMLGVLNGHREKAPTYACVRSNTPAVFSKVDIIVIVKMKSIKTRPAYSEQKSLMVKIGGSYKMIRWFQNRLRVAKKKWPKFTQVV